MRGDRRHPISVLAALLVVAATASPAIASTHPGHAAGASSAEWTGPARQGPGTSQQGERHAGRPWWTTRVDALVEGKQISVAIGLDGRFLYLHGARVRRPPASNEKLLLSMALLDRLGPDAQLTTEVAVPRPPVNGVVNGNLWLIGSGDPEVGPERIGELAKQVADAGVVRIEGSVLGSTGPFLRDWWAFGWKREFPSEEVAFPTALTYRGNVGPAGRHLSDPELLAAEALTKALRRRGVHVIGEPRRGLPTAKALTPIASAASDPIIDIIHRMDVNSVNFDAEVLGKVLGQTATGKPGSIARGAAAIHAYAVRHGASGDVAYDASGLSYANRASALGIVRLLWSAEGADWGMQLRFALAIPGEGTLEHRLRDLRVRAKTGTLTDVSALSGWVWSRRAHDWVAFSILAQHLDYWTAVGIEDAIVRLVSRHASAGAGQSSAA